MDLLQNLVIIFFILVLFSLTFLTIISNWKLYKKAGRSGWVSIIPVYNFAILLEIVGRPTWWIILSFIPVVNFIVYCIALNGLAKSFGKNINFAIGLILLPFVFFPILAFGKGTYVQPNISQSNLGATTAGLQAQRYPDQGGKIKKRSNLLLVILILILLIILGFIANHYLRIYRGCPYNNRQIHYSFNTGCALMEESFPFNSCAYDGTCRSFIAPEYGKLTISARPIQEIILSQYADIKESATQLDLHNLFSDISNVNRQSINFTYSFINKKLIEKVQPFSDYESGSISKEFEIEPFLTNKNGVNFYRFMNRYCAAGDSYSVCFVPEQSTLLSENEILKLLNTFKFN